MSATFYQPFEDEQPRQRGLARFLSWFRRSPQQTPQSAYLTLIPLSDARLRPTRTRLIISASLLFTCAAICAVFFLVPRGISVGTIKVKSSTISFNTSIMSFTLLLGTTIPIYNPNFVKVQISGNVIVSFYDKQAGYTQLPDYHVEPRSAPQVMELELDASNVPPDYKGAVYAQCISAPQKVVFLLLGNLTATYLGSKYQLPLIDTYFILDCNIGSSDKQ